MVIYNPEIKEVLDTFLLEIPIVVPGKMFGYPAYYVNKKLFACVYEDGVGIKVPLEIANELIGSGGVSDFIPMGRRKMKEWIYICRKDPQEYLNDKEVFGRSIDFVEAIGLEKRGDNK